MCGIAGILNFNNSAPDPALIRAMNRCMQHRGPDAEAFYESGPIALGHRRLSIIDLSESANQPMADASGRYWLVFNGEIYNFMEVKAKLPNYPYRTHGDSEVILAAYAAWGVDCLQHFAGMFALAIWDTQQQSLFIAWYTWPMNLSKLYRLGRQVRCVYKQSGFLILTTYSRSLTGRFAPR